MELSRQEIRLIKNHREEIAEAKRAELRQKSCSHENTVFMGYSRRESARRCYDCGKVIFD